MIELRDLTIGYKEPLISDINLKFDSLSYAILGESGCGKTTLLRTICGLQKPLSGQVYINDKIVLKGPHKDVFMVHQHYTNYNWLSCLENVLLAAKVKGTLTQNSKNEALIALDKVGLKEKKDYLPCELSGGQEQRLALARTLFVKPKYLLMDEPLSALDPITRMQMQELIKDMQYETKSTIIMITHSPEEAERVCNKIINLEKGCLRNGVKGFSI